MIQAIQATDPLHASVATFVEFSIVIESRYGTAGLHDLDRFLNRPRIELVAVDAEQGRIAREAFSRFGKGRHRAALNYGDCFSCALAVSLGQPLLCKGQDFSETDIQLVLDGESES